MNKIYNVLVKTLQEVRTIIVHDRWNKKRFEKTKSDRGKKSYNKNKIKLSKLKVHHYF